MTVWPASRNLTGIMIAALDEKAALSYLNQAMRAPQTKAASMLAVAFCNAHVVNLAAHDASFRSALQNMLVLPDGIGVDIGSRLLYGAPFPANLNGTDFIPRLIFSSPSPLSIALIGARRGVAERAAGALKAHDPRHDINVLGHGYFDAAAEQLILEGLKSSPVDLLLVAFGNPRQEIWITQKIGPEHARLAMGVGALFDFLAGEVARAPLWLRRLRLEWAWRLAQEPSRLWQRYIMGNPIFLWRILRQKFRGASQ